MQMLRHHILLFFLTLVDHLSDGFAPIHPRALKLNSPYRKSSRRAFVDAQVVVELTSSTLHHMSASVVDHNLISQSNFWLADAATVAEDNGWFGTGLLKGVDPWGSWQVNVILGFHSHL